MRTRPLSSQGACRLVLCPSPDPTPPDHGHAMNHIRAASASSPWNHVDWRPSGLSKAVPGLGCPGLARPGSSRFCRRDEEELFHLGGILSVGFAASLLCHLQACASGESFEPQLPHLRIGGNSTTPLPGLLAGVTELIPVKS